MKDEMKSGGGNEKGGVGEIKNNSQFLEKNLGRRGPDRDSWLLHSCLVLHMTLKNHSKFQDLIT